MTGENFRRHDQTSFGPLWSVLDFYGYLCKLDVSMATATVKPPSKRKFVFFI